MSLVCTTSRRANTKSGGRSRDWNGRKLSQISASTPKYTVKVKIGGESIRMEVDTGVECPRHQKGCTSADYNGIRILEKLQSSFETTMDLS